MGEMSDCGDWKPLAVVWLVGVMEPDRLLLLASPEPLSSRRRFKVWPTLNVPTSAWSDWDLDMAVVGSAEAVVFHEEAEVRGND